MKRPRSHFWTISRFRKPLTFNLEPLTPTRRPQSLIFNLYSLTTLSLSLYPLSFSQDIPNSRSQIPNTSPPTLPAPTATQFQTPNSRSRIQNPSAFPPSSAFYTPDSPSALSPYPLAFPSGPQPSASESPTLYGSSPQNATSALGTPAFIAAPQAFVAGLIENPFRWGPFDVRPYANYNFTYATGLNFRPGNQEDTVSHSFSPGLTLQSPHITIDYSPTFRWYTKGPYDDSINHRASISTWFGYDQWRFGLNHSYTLSEQILIETGTQTETESHSTSVTAGYQHSYRTSFDFSVSQSIQETDEFNSSKNWSTMNWINYRLYDKTSIGAGVGGGYSQVEQGSDMTYEMIQGRISWFPVPKFSASVNGGIEIRQFIDQQGAGDRINPIMGASASYQLFDYTSLSLSANRSVNTSLFANQITENTSVSASLSQRFLGRLNFGLSAGYTVSDYQTSVVFFDTDRSDTRKFISASLGTKILKRGYTSVAYTHSQNDSSAEGFTYDSDQYTFSLGYRF